MPIVPEQQVETHTEAIRVQCPRLDIVDVEGGQGAPKGHETIEGLPEVGVVEKEPITG